MKHIIRAAARVTAVSLIAGGAAAALTYGIDHQHSLDPTPRAVTPSNPTGDTPLTPEQRQSLMDRHAALIAALPFYGKAAPKGCLEDMVCWIGTNHDGRDDDSIIADLPHDIVAAEKSYPDEGTGWDKVNQQMGDALAEGSDKPSTYRWEDCWMHVADTTVVVCPDGQVVTS